MVCNVAVSPGADVHVVAHPRGWAGNRVLLEVEQPALRYAYDPDRERPGRHPLLEAVLAQATLPPSHDFEITVRSALPAGSALGTSAAVAVALAAALDALTPGRSAPTDLAAIAHRVETEVLGLQSGVQDQLASAYGGISLIEIDEYPEARVTAVPVAEGTRRALHERLLLVYLGRPHVSSAIHEQVISSLERDPAATERLEPLRRAARSGAAALEAGDLDRYGYALVENTHAQARLHPALVDQEARDVIEIARRHDATGWKVNGAGGAGGSVSILGPADPVARARLAAAFQRADRAWHVFPIGLDRDGVRVDTSPR